MLKLVNNNRDRDTRNLMSETKFYDIVGGMIQKNVMKVGTIQSHVLWKCTEISTKRK